ncbi:MAG TPA: hypothetical protein P5246_05330 [Candidatus Omnitrophota bacterium]|jgi:DNA polymerase III delta subunit|nr:hypothetical protein [Candidatus Omnitrophota bacterium]HSA30971.1 hypothetical protein [Candidatus Omnitrophota bacterium]
MHVLLLGQDHKSKTQTIQSLKSKILPKEAWDFDYDALYGHKLGADELKKNLMALPAVASQRIVVIHQAEKLGAPHKEIICEFFALEQTAVILVLDSEQWQEGDPFVRKILKYVSISGAASGERDTIFSVTRYISSGQPAAALKVLRSLLEAGEYPLQLMGGLVWFWGHKARLRLHAEKFKKGLLHLQEADLCLKRSRLSADHALEVLVTQLSLLMK